MPRKYRRRSRGYSARPKRQYFWTTDAATNVLAPTTGIADNDPILATIDYETGGSLADMEKVHVHRVIFDVHHSVVGMNAAGGANIIYDWALVMSGPDQMTAITTAALTVSTLRAVDVRILRTKFFAYQEPSQATAVGAYVPRRGPSWSVNMKTNFIMKEPQQLYYYQRPQTTDSVADTYEYHYRASCLCSRA